MARVMTWRIRPALEIATPLFTLVGVVDEADSAPPVAWRIRLAMSAGIKSL